MRLLKLMAYALFGYALYEFVRGMTNAEEQASARPAMSSGGGSPAPVAQRRQQNITGPGEGADVETVGADGAAMHHKVGRGVVRK